MFKLEELRSIEVKLADGNWQIGRMDQVEKNDIFRIREGDGKLVVRQGTTEFQATSSCEVNIISVGGKQNEDGTTMRTLPCTFRLSADSYIKTEE